VVGTRLDKIKKIDFVKLSQEIFTLINKVRSDPQSFIKTLEKSMARFEFGTNVLKSADELARVETREGQIAYVEAIEFLRA